MSYFSPLVAHEVPLSGRHLIEASAGTGKTFNITRLYLRLLLEKKLTVQQILVMTFTKDATEEIRGRIGQTLRDTIAQWDKLCQSEPFYQALGNLCSKPEALLLLHRALLFLDEAAIFTLHGFCKRTLTEYAFESGLAFDLNMESSCQEQTIEAVEDWYRIVAKQSPQDYLSVVEFWPEPASFIHAFSSAINKANQLNVLDPGSLTEAFLQQVVTAKQTLLANTEILYQALIDVKKGKEREQRISELNQLLTWLDLVINDVEQYKSEPPLAFIDGRRFSRSQFKEQLKQIFEVINQVKKQRDKLADNIARAKAYGIVKQALIKINASICAKKQLRALMSFDDLISILSDKLLNNLSLAKQIAHQYPVALVDEFQDTDLLQFTILKALYNDACDDGDIKDKSVNDAHATLNVAQKHPTKALYLIGDPKQAIYGFRGGDIFTYLSASKFCQYHWVMDTNWRSTVEMITGYNRLFYGNKLDKPAKEVFGFNIPYLPVKASPKAIKAHQQLSDSMNQTLCQQQQDRALQFIYFEPEDEKSSQVKAGFRAQMAIWCAQKITQLLTTEDVLNTPESKSYQASDIAILVRDGGEAELIKQALTEHSLASVYLSNRASLWHSLQARQLLRVLKGIFYLENDRYFVAALASGLLGYNHQTLNDTQKQELQWQTVKYQFKAIREQWQSKGFICAALTLLHKHVVVKTADKDRVLTNLLHLFELLQAASQQHRQPQALIFWFEQQQKIELADNVAELRLESDDNLIKIVTQHGAKGLEYPVVFVPFASRYKDPLKVGLRKVSVVTSHNKAGELVTSLGGNEIEKVRMSEEAYAEAVRLLYVAVTRAEQQCYLLVAPFEKNHLSPLGKTLHWQEQQDIQTSLQDMAEQYPQAIGYHHILSGEDQPYAKVNDRQVQENLIVSQFTSHIERDWWLSSFSALSRNARHGGVSLPDRDIQTNLAQDQPVNEVTPVVNTEPNYLIQFAMVKGAQTGNLLHDLLEHGDFSQPSWLATISAFTGKYANVMGDWQPQELEQWLLAICRCPIFDIKNNAEIDTGADNKNQLSGLQQLANDKVLKESEFYFPMQKASSQRLSDILMAHRRRISRLSAIDSVQLPEYRALKGMMHGFIDLVFEHQGKFYVCDYKSTYLGDSLLHYSASSLQQNIFKHYYDLQYLIYSLALHRYLASRLENYQPDQHFGGVYYLYLRGMNKHNAESGVFYTDITVDELNQLDALFQGKVINNMDAASQQGSDRR